MPASVVPFQSYIRKPRPRGSFSKGLPDPPFENEPVCLDALTSKKSWKNVTWQRPVLPAISANYCQFYGMCPYDGLTFVRMPPRTFENTKIFAAFAPTAIRVTFFRALLTDRDSRFRTKLKCIARP